MRVSVVLLVILGLFACGQALDLKEIGTTLVNTLVEKGKSFLADAAQKLLGGFDLSSLFGKREITGFKDVLDKLRGLVDHGKSLAAKAFGGAVEKLRDIVGKFHAKLGLLKGSKAASDEVDDVVAEHHVEHKRILADLFQKGKDLLGKAVETVKGLASGLKAKASEIVSKLLQGGTDLFLGKRATLSDHLSSVGNFLSGAFSPFKDIVAGLGNTLKGHFSNLVDTVKGHVDALKGKLSGHVSDLKTHGSTLLDHGKNALGALSEVVTDILKQTLGNAQPAIDALAKTAAGAGKTVVDHFTGADGTF